MPPATSSTPWAGESASTSKSSEVAHPPPTPTSAPVAEIVPTELLSAISRRKLNANTPLIADAWHKALTAANLLSKYPSIPSGIKSGFRVGIPNIISTHTPPNSPSLITHNSHFHQILRHELSTGRFLGPFSRVTIEALIGPFQSSPLSIIPKPHKPDAFRLIQNFSFPHSNLPYPSINHTINSDDYPCTWGTFNTICLIVWYLPEGSQAAVRDIAEAYRTMPLHPSQWPGAVVRISPNDQFCIDTSAAFGVASNAGAYGHIADAGTDIMRSRGLGPISKWVDDHVFFRVPTAKISDYNRLRKAWATSIADHGGMHKSGGRIWYGGAILPDDRVAEFDEDLLFPITTQPGQDGIFPYSMEDIDRLSDELGIPWQKDKDRPFSQSFTFTGFDWNIQKKTVALTEAKRLKSCTAN
ncbi:hypothetical protein NLI96_g13248 [Meripilus lineatus]|uniref:Uncharacterized protein n=1 Tax=Meripilus lineatus TaxID=2056292 RepID=A0AAD5UNC9_9APHY|nr:hypothetical protein NLI96_g13248 [Physisporinus lineatus]